MHAQCVMMMVVIWEGLSLDLIDSDTFLQLFITREAPQHPEARHAGERATRAGGDQCFVTPRQEDP